MLKLRRGKVVSIESENERVARLTVELEDGSKRPALSYPQLTGKVGDGDDVVVNTEALDLQLGSGGFDIVHVNLSRLDGEGHAGAHVMKLNYSSLQHAVEPIEQGLDSFELPLALDVCVLALHGQLACVAFAYAEVATGKKLGFVQTAGGALPGWLSDTVADLLERGLLCDHVTAGSSFGGAHEAITTEGALDAGARKLGWDAAVVGPGPGIIGSASALGHGGLYALGNARAALALGCRVVLAPRLSSSDPRERHRGVSHHTQTVSRLLEDEVELPMPDEVEGLDELVVSYKASGLPAKTMGRTIDEDPDFFRAALAAGAALGRRR